MQGDGSRLCECLRLQGWNVQKSRRMFSVSENSPVLDLDFILVIDCPWF